MGTTIAKKHTTSIIPEDGDSTSLYNIKDLQQILL
jgi:hypothetical protein